MNSYLSGNEYHLLALIPQSLHLFLAILRVLTLLQRQNFVLEPGSADLRILFVKILILQGLFCVNVLD